MENNELEMKRHSCAHIMAAAGQQLFPNTKLGIGPAVENGFYYDVDFVTPISAADLSKVEAEMKKITKENLKLERFTLPKDEALKLVANEPYKVELILSELCEAQKQSELCHRLVFFGRDICSARAPKCAECPLRALCDRYKRSTK